MADEVASLLVRITADGSQAVGVLNGITATVGTLADKNATLLNKVSAVGTLAGKVGATITKTFGVATVAGLAASAKAAGQLNKELANIGTLSVPTERLKEFKGQIQDIAIATGKDTSDISEGTYQVISAFGDAADTMAKVEINAKAAKAGLATTADSIALTSAVTKAYGDTSAEAVQFVADLAFKTVELGQTTFPELAQSMQQVTSLSKELGVSQQELFGAYATLTGVTGNAAEVQTQMKAVYTALLKPSENMEAAISKLGYSSGFAMIKSLGFASTLNALKSATNGSEEQMLGLFNNVRAMPAVMALTGAQADVFAEKLGKMENASGAATKAFEVQTEGVAKTGFTLEQAKVKMQVAAQNFGESAAPIIADFADIVDRASTKLASLSDEERQAIINTGVLTTKVGVGLAVGGKALTMGTQLAWMIKAIGPAVTAGITSPAGIAAVAIAGLGLVGKAAYDGFYNSVYNFAEGLDEETEELKQSYSQMKKLSDLQREFSELNNEINLGDLKGEELANAQSRLDEITKILKDEYKLDVDSGDIDEALEKANALNKLDFYRNKNDFKKEIDSKQNSYNDAVKELPRVQAEYDSATQKAEKYDTVLANLRETQDKYNSGTMTSAEYMDYFAETVDKLGKDTGMGDSWGSDIANNAQLAGQSVDELLHYFEENVGTLKNGLNIEKLAEEIRLYEENIQKYKDAVQGLADINVSQFEDAFKSGSNTEQYIAGIKKYTEAGILSADEYAKKLTQVTSGVEDVNTAWQQAQNGDNTALNNFITGYINNMQKLGATTEETVQGAALLREGFSKAADVPDDKINSVINSLRELGNAQGLDMTSEKLTEMAQAMNLIPEGKKIEITADGEIKIIDEAKEKVEELPDEHNTDIITTDKTSEGIKNAETNLSTLPTEHTITIKTVLGSTMGFSASNAPWAPKAKGTLNFPGGLAMVNDDGKKDPRELIIDRGRAFIPEGRDVILPLSRGAKVYTSDQTKAIMSGIGIPHYADGKDNSDAFISARDNWAHYTKTHSVTSAQELEKWLEFQKQYAKNEKDIWDIEEQVFSLQKKLYSERVSESEKWLAHEEKYNGMSAADYLAGIDRMRAYTEEYYADGIISHREYIEAKKGLDEDYIDKSRELLAEQFDTSKAYISEHTYFNDWGDTDSPEAAYDRVMSRHKEALEAGTITKAQYDEYAKDLGSAMYSERRDQSGNWLDEQEKYFGMEADAYISGLEREKAYTEEYYRKGLIDRQTYNEGMTELNHAVWDKASEAYDDMLSKQSGYISDMREQFQKEEQALRDSWTVDDRKIDMAEVSAQLDIYAGAVTDRGQQKYKELQEQMKQLQRDEELYNLQVKNNAVIEGLEADYEAAEDMKADFLKSIVANTDIDVSGIVGDLTSKISGTGNDITNLLGQLLTAFENFKIDAPSTTYADNRVVTVNGVSSSELGTFMGGVR